MLSPYCQHIFDLSNKAMDDRGNLLSLYQELGDNFYPERADFMTTRSIGTDYASHLTTSAPLNARRDLGNIFSTMLRPSDKEWNEATTSRPDKQSMEDKRWLKWATKLMNNMMKDEKAKFNQCMTACDHDLATFGNAAYSLELNEETMTLMYKNHHLKDMAWMEDDDGTMYMVARNDSQYAFVLKNKFKDKVHTEVDKLMKETRFARVQVRHVVVKNKDYKSETGKRFKTSHVSIWYDVANQHVMEEKGINHRFYGIIRWSLVTGSQYALSPATLGALPDARLMQDVFLTILEAGQKAVDPPMLGKQEVVKNAELYAGGMSWIDAEYDDRLGDPLRPLAMDTSALPFSIEILQMIQVGINNAMYLNKIALPEITRQMTAFEAGQRVTEYVRQAVPLFEPLESNYNALVCEHTFEFGMAMKAFGPVEDIPKSLQGQDIGFKFKNPLRETADMAKGQKMAEGLAIIGSAAGVDPTVNVIPKVTRATRDALLGIGWDPEWIRSEEEADAAIAEQNEKQSQANMLATMQAGADIAKTGSEAAANLNGMMG